MMCWQKIVFIVWTLYVIAANIATINKPKTPTKTTGNSLRGHRLYSHHGNGHQHLRKEESWE